MYIILIEFWGIKVPHSANHGIFLSLATGGLTLALAAGLGSVSHPDNLGE
jgi:hypothetical protein